MSIGVYEKENVAVSRVSASIPSGRDLSPIDRNYIGVSGVCDLKRTVSRSIVDHNDLVLEIPCRLADRAQGRRKLYFFIVSRNDEREHK